jgi:hypothetical protein
VGEGWPRFFGVRQQVVGPLVEDVAGEVRAGLERLGLEDLVRPGDSVAVGVGSRGIADVAGAVRAVVVHLLDLGADPFVVPAMGSHGGGTAAGQEATLAARGVTEQTVGCRVRSTMEAVEVGRSSHGFPLLVDAHAAAADHVVVVNRVKPHTMFTGEVESGLSKMLMLGLGKQAGAAIYHGAILDHGWMPVVRDVVPRLVRAAGVLAGVALVERGDDRTARVAVVPGDRLLDDEPALLRDARRWMAKLPFGDVDLLLIDRIGKDVSGAGFDVNVVGRKGSPHEVHGDAPARVRTIAVRGLTEATHGNALGIGLAELCRSRVLEEMDVEATRLNALTAGDVPAAMTPLPYGTDAEMIAAGLRLVGLRGPQEARVCWIRDTLRLRHSVCSEAYLDAAREREDLEVLGAPLPLPLDDDGNLPDDLPNRLLVGS